MAIALVWALMAPCWTVHAAGKTPVYVTASLTDKNRLYIEDLTQQEIQVFENGTAREIEFLAGPELPTAYGVLFQQALLPKHWEDDRLARSGGLSIRDVLYELIDKHLAKQSIWVATYDRELKMALEPTVGRDRVKESIQQLYSRRKGADPFLYAALFEAVQIMAQRSEKRRVILLFLDSLDVESAGKSKAIKNLLSVSNVELFVVSFATKLHQTNWGTPYAMNRAGLKGLARSTAGDAYFALEYGPHSTDLSRRLYNHIRTLYTLGFTSTSSDEKPTPLRIECIRPGSKVNGHTSLFPVQ